MVFYFASSFADIAYRFFQVALLVLMFLIFSEKLIYFNPLRVKPLIIGLLSICLWFSFSNIRYVATETQSHIMSQRGNLDFNYLPYSLFYESNYRDINN
jgi:hypothetical protein